MMAVVAPTITTNSAPPAANPKMAKGERIIAISDLRLEKHGSLKTSTNGGSLLKSHTEKSPDLTDVDSFTIKGEAAGLLETIRMQIRKEQHVVAKVPCERVRVTRKQGRRRWNVACQQQHL